MRYAVFKRIFLLLTLALLLGTACRKIQYQENCDDDYKADSVERAHLWMQRHRLGDTLYMKAYMILKDSVQRKYIYTGEKIYTTKDSSIEHDWYEYYGASCSKSIDRLGAFIHYKGKDALKVGLWPHEETDVLTVGFRGLSFQIDNDQYFLHNNNTWHERYTMGGKEYYDVNSFGYRDSSMAFYNTDYGLLRLIIGDSLVLERDIR